MTVRRIGIALLALLLVAPALAQSSEDELGTWWIYNGTVFFDDHWNLFTEVQYRTWETVSNPQEVFLRLAGQYDFTPNVMVGLGYTRAKTWGYDEFEGEDSTEDRLHQQFGLRHFVHRTRFEHRYRFEQRWIHFDRGTEYRNRFRYRLQVTAPLNRKTLEPGAWFINAFDELFINLGSEPSFDQNRVYAAAGYQFRKTASIQFGGLWQARQNVNYLRLQAFLTWNFDLRNKNRAGGYKESMASTEE